MCLTTFLIKKHKAKQHERQNAEQGPHSVGIVKKNQTSAPYQQGVGQIS